MLNIFLLQDTPVVFPWTPHSKTVNYSRYNCPPMLEHTNQLHLPKTFSKTSTNVSRLKPRRLVSQVTTNWCTCQDTDRFFITSRAALRCGHATVFHVARGVFNARRAAADHQRVRCKFKYHTYIQKCCSTESLLYWLAHHFASFCKFCLRCSGRWKSEDVLNKQHQKEHRLWQYAEGTQALLSLVLGAARVVTTWKLPYRTVDPKRHPLRTRESEKQFTSKNEVYVTSH